MGRSGPILPLPLQSVLAPVLQESGVLACYLFGSRARGDFRPDSDCDLAVLWKDKTPDLLEREVRLEARLNALLSPVKADVVSLQRVPLEFAFHLLGEGILLYSIDDERRADFEERVIRDYLDFAPVLARYYQEMQEGLREDLADG